MRTWEDEGLFLYLFNYEASLNPYEFGVKMMERKPFEAFCEFWFHLLLSSYIVLKCTKIRHTSSEYGTLWVFPFYKTLMWPSFSSVQFSPNQTQLSFSMHHGFVPSHNMEISIQSHSNPLNKRVVILLKVLPSLERVLSIFIHTHTPFSCSFSLSLSPVWSLK